MPTLRTRVSSEASLETFEGNISLDPFEDQWGCRFRAARISNGVRSPMFRKAGPKSVRFNSNPVHEPLRPVITRPVSHNSSLTSSDYSEPSLGVSTEGLTSTTTTLALSEEQQRYARKNPYTDMEEALQENPLRCVSASAGSEFATSEPAMPKTPLCVRPTQLTLGPSLERTAEKSTQEVQSLWGLDNDAPSPLIQPPTNEQATNIRILALQEQCHLNEAVLGDQEGEITELSTKLLTLENTLHSALECQQRQRTTIENLEKARALTETKVTELQTVEEDQKKVRRTTGRLPARIPY